MELIHNRVNKFDKDAKSAWQITFVALFILLGGCSTEKQQPLAVLVSDEVDTAPASPEELKRVEQQRESVDQLKRRRAEALKKAEVLAEKKKASKAKLKKKKAEARARKEVVKARRLESSKNTQKPNQPSGKPRIAASNGLKTGIVIGSSAVKSGAVVGNSNVRMGGLSGDLAVNSVKVSKAGELVGVFNNSSSKSITQGANAVLPEFPWPPERPSSHTVLPRKGELSRDKTLSLDDVQKLLSEGLLAADYSQQSYYRVPGGFALVTRLEGIDKNGAPLGEERRYQLNDDNSAFSLTKYIKELFLAPEGLYRFLVFVVSNESFVTSSKTLTEEKAIERLEEGAVSFPVSEFETKEFTNAHSITVLIYEYTIDQSSKKPSLKLPGRISPKAHLTNSRISAELDKVLAPNL